MFDQQWRGKYFWWTVYVLCILALFIQIYPLLRSKFPTLTMLTKFSSRAYIYPTKTSTRQEEVSMKDFPLLTRVCVRPGFDMVALRRAGYFSTDGYFSGKSMFNSSLIGWAGHSKDGKVAGTVEELFDTVKQNVSLKNYSFSIIVTTMLGGKIALNIDELAQEERLNYPDNCQTLDVTQNFKVKMEGVKDIQFRFWSFPAGVSVSVILLGKSSGCSRTLAELAFYHSGETIDFANSWEKRYAVKILGNEFVEEDPGNDCRNYPNDDFLSYKDCDDDYLRKEVDRISPDLQPIWLTDHLSLATAQKVFQNSSGKGSFVFRILHNHG